MAINKHIFFYAALITLLLFISIYSLNAYLNSQREKAVIDRMQDILDEYQEIQTLSLMSEVFGKEMTCPSSENTLSQLDKTLWDTGLKIDKYREATENFITDPFYINQKIKFNRNEAIYFSMFRKMKDACNVNQTVISFFYKKKEFCKDCDAQSFVLTDINKEIGDEIAIFSFDADLGLLSIKSLEAFFNVTSFPCMVIESGTYCGLKDKNEVIDIICKYRHHSICKN